LGGDERAIGRSRTPETMMRFGDAKKMTEEIVRAMA
jgi:hypothetical protein